MTNPEILKAVTTKTNFSLLEEEIQELRKRGQMYADNTESMNYLVSPIYGRFDNLAPITLFVRANDDYLFVADCRKFKAKIEEEEGLTVSYQEF